MVGKKIISDKNAADVVDKVSPVILKETKDVITVEGVVG